MTTTPGQHLTIYLSRRAALKLGLGGLLGTALTACSTKSNRTSATEASNKPLDAAKLAGFLAGTWDFTFTRDLRDGSTPPSSFPGTIKITGTTWDLQLGQGKTQDATVVPFTDDGNGNARGTWQLATNSIAITPTYGTGPFFGDKGAPWWSTLTASGLSGTPHNGQEIKLSWSPTLSGNDTDLTVNPGTLDVHITTSRKITLTHTMNQPADPQMKPDQTVTTFQASRR